MKKTTTTIKKQWQTPEVILLDRNREVHGGGANNAQHEGGKTINFQTFNDYYVVTPGSGQLKVSKTDFESFVS